MEPCRGSSRFKQHERKVYTDDGIDDEDIEGRREFNVEEKLLSNKYNCNFIQPLKGHELTLAWVQEHGFSTPLLIEEKTGLGMRVPSQNFTVNDVKQCVGSRRILDVMDTRTQQAMSMTMKEWASYFAESSEARRRRLLNVISLEFSHTRLENYVEQPAIVHQMDWVDRAWPRHLKRGQTETTNIIKDMRYPKVQRYCLMSVAECYTDFHIDMGGTSVWYHILHGKKIFWMIPPTEENLELYEKWTLSGKQGDMFFGDKVNKCQRVTLQAGSTFFIPPGWIHAVYTPEDSLVFGGNFMHSFNIETQLRCYEVENTTHVPQKFRYPFFVEMHWYVLERYVYCLTGRAHLAGPDSDPAGRAGGWSECSSGLSSEPSLHDSTEFSPPTSPIADEHSYVSSGSDGGKVTLRKCPDTKGGGGAYRMGGGAASAECSLRPVSVKLEKLTDQQSRGLLVAAPGGRAKAGARGAWVHLTSHELAGLAVAADWLDSLAPNKKHVPSGIDDPDALLSDVRELLAQHADDDQKLAISGEKVLKWPPSKQTVSVRRVSRPGGQPGGVPGRRRRVRCKACEACTRHDCGECRRCKDMRKFGGPGRMKQTCFSRQCMAPMLPHTSVCHLCERGEPDSEAAAAVPAELSLMECNVCYKISHPRCVRDAGQTGSGQPNEDLPNSWLCPACDGGGGGTVPDDKSEIKVAADCKWSGAGERKTVVKTSPPAAARPATPRRDNADASERKKVLRSPDSGARSGPRPGGRAALNGGGDGPKIKRRPRQDGDGVGSPVGKRILVELKSSPPATQNIGGGANDKSGPPPKLTSRGREADAAGTAMLDDGEDGHRDWPSGGDLPVHPATPLTPCHLLPKYVVRPAPISPPPRHVSTSQGARHVADYAVWLRVFRYLPAGALSRCMAVCKTWNRWCLSAGLWRCVDLSHRRLRRTHLVGVVRRQPAALDLGWTNVSQRQLLWLLPRLPHLHTLRLTGASWAAAVALCCSDCPLLATLDLRWVEGLRDPSLIDLLAAPADRRPGASDAACRLRLCHCLALAGSDVTDAGLALLSDRLPQLTSLDLSYCTQVHDAGIEALVAGALTLTTLCLDGCSRLTDDCLLYLAKAPCLQTVSLRACTLITRSACQHFIDKPHGGRVFVMRDHCIMEEKYAEP